MENVLEVIAFNIDCCSTIERSGAHRIELCASPEAGGTTPSYGLVMNARKLTSIDIFPMIRPRSGNFVYSHAEFEVMRSDVEFCRDAGCDGIVTGILNEDGTVDKERLQQLVELAFPMDVTFHRAFDKTKDPYKALEDIIDCGCERILTSGQQATAMEGIDLIKSLVSIAGERIIIMPGSGIRSSNISKIAELSGAVEFHTSATTTSTHVFADESEVKKMVLILNENEDQ